MQTTPCYQCPDRCVGCHSACEKYTEYRKTVDDANKRRRAAAAASEAFALRGDRIRRDAHKYGLFGRRR